MTLVRQGILWSEIIAIFRRGSGMENIKSVNDVMNLFT